MFTKTIKESDMEPLCIASLPTRPNAPTSLGGKGFTANEMKKCFDALPRFIAGRLNQLIEELKDGLVEELAGDIDMGLPYTGYSFGTFIEDFGRGTLVNYLHLGEGGPTVGEVLPPLVDKVNAFYYMDKDYVIDAGRVSERGGVANG